MKYQVFKTTLSFEEQKKRLSNISLIALGSVGIFITAVWFYPSFYSYLMGGLSLAITLYYLIKVVCRKQLIIDLDEDGIRYLNNQDELVFISWKEIKSIKNSFGELEFITETDHKKLDLSLLKAQERWEIKNIVSSNSKIGGFKL